MTPGLVSYLLKMFRLYTRDPSTRSASARHILAASIALYAEHTSPAEASLAASEAVAGLAASDRRRGVA